MICGTSYYILHKVIQANHKADENMKKMHISQERKGLASLVLYSLSIVFAFYNTAISGGAVCCCGCDVARAGSEY